eukprot:2337807-Prymnesium_polylepis.1
MGDDVARGAVSSDTQLCVSLDGRWPMADDVARGRCRVATRGPAVPLSVWHEIRVDERTNR